MSTPYQPSSPFEEARRSKNPSWPIPANRYDLVEFNLITGNYRDLIGRIRSLLQQPGRYSHNLPVLPVRRHVEPQDWLDLLLSIGKRSITLRIRKHNLWLDGYQMENSRWIEFNREEGESAHLIPGSSFLSFTASYADLERVGGMPLTDLQISRAQVLNAVEELALINDERWRARHLSLLALVVCEATRFEALARTFASVLKQGSTITHRVDESMLTLLRAWGDLSGRLLRADITGDQYFCLPSNADHTIRSRIRTVYDASSFMGVLLGPVGLPIYDAYAPPGQPLMEVLSLQILDFSSREACITITVTDGLGKQVLDFDFPSCVRPRDTFKLKRLERAISAWESVLVTYDVTLRDKEMNFTGSDSWDIFHTTSPYTLMVNTTTCATPKQVVLRGCRCVGMNKIYSEMVEVSLALNYQIHPSAWQVNWEAKVLGADGYNHLNLYGYFKIKYWVRGKYYEVMLFLRSWEDNAEVGVGGCIPLCRSVTAVPLHIDVMVEADLMDRMYSVFSWDRLVIRDRATRRFGGKEFGDADSGRFLFMHNRLIQITAKWSRMSQC